MTFDLDSLTPAELERFLKLSEKEQTEFLQEIETEKDILDTLLARQEHKVRKAITSVLIALEKAKEKHPKWPEGRTVQAAIVGEESGELLRAALQYEFEHGSPVEMHKEATHTGAMALRFLENL